MRIGIDLGGTKIEGILLDSQGAEKKRLRYATPRGSYSQTLQAIVEIVKSLEEGLKEKSKVGIGTPGTLSPHTGVLKNSNSVWLIGQPLDKDLEKALGRPVTLANDANCFALSEATDGAAAGAPIVFGVILGTGVGGGIVVNGRPVDGPNRIAGEWGHNPLPWPQANELPGATCYCGLKGCIETFISGPGLERAYQERTQNTLSGSEIVEKGAAGDTDANFVLENYADRLARGLASIINVLDPTVIVLGGGVSNHLYLYDRVPQLWDRYVFSDVVDTKLVRARFGDSSGVRGAAWL